MTFWHRYANAEKLAYTDLIRTALEDHVCIQGNIPLTLPPKHDPHPSHHQSPQAKSLKENLKTRPHRCVHTGFPAPHTTTVCKHALGVRTHESHGCPLANLISVANSPGQFVTIRGKFIKLVRVCACVLVLFLKPRI